MKKLMIGSLLLIPIIIMIIISITSNIVSKATYIGVESITFSTDTYVLDNYPERDIFYAKDFLNPEVMPRRASNKTIVWSIDEITYFDTVYQENYNANPNTVQPAAVLLDAHDDPVSNNTTGTFRVNCDCSFEITAQAETQKVVCMIYAGGKDVRSIKISYNDETSVNVKVGETISLYNIYTPITAISSITEWESSNEEIATVDKMGVVTILKEGDANITLKMSINSTEGGNVQYITSNVFVIHAEAASSKFGSEIFVHSRTLSLSGLDIEGAVAIDGCTISGDTLTIEDGVDTITIDTDRGPLTISICDETDIKINNAKHISSDSEYILGVDRDALNLSASFKSVLANGKPQVTWSLDNTEGFAITQEGVLTATKSGFVTVTATVGGKSASIQIHAEVKVNHISLTMSNSSLKVGIAKETIFADAQYIEDLSAIKDNTLLIGIRQPNDLPIDKFVFTVDDTSKAHFDGNMLVFNHDAILENTTLQITVSAKYPLFIHNTGASTSYLTIKVANAVKAATEAELKKACEDRYNICLYGDIQMSNQSTNLHTDLYGNNHMISLTSEFLTGNVDNGAGVLTIRSDNLISNAIFRSDEPKETMDNTDGAKGMKGTSLEWMWETPYETKEDGTYKGYENRINCRIEYCVLENGSSCIRAYGVDLVVDGCVLRNTSEVGIYTRSLNYDNSRPERFIEYSNITLNNCISSNMIGTAFNYQYNDNFYRNADSSEYTINNYYIDERGLRKADITIDLQPNEKYFIRYTLENEKTPSELMDVLVYDADHMGSLKQTGFLDIYNWQNIYEVSLLSGSLNLKDSELMLISMATEEIFSSKAFEPYRWEDRAATGDTQKYVHMGIISNGVTSPSLLEATFEDKRFVYLDTTDPYFKSKLIDLSLGGIYYSLLINNHMKFFVYDKSSNITPKSTYVLDKWTIDKLNPNN